MVRNADGWRCSRDGYNHEYNREMFHLKMRKSMDTVRKILSDTLKPKHPEQVSHTYDDKFGLAEFSTNLSVVAAMNVMEKIGLDKPKLEKLIASMKHGNKSLTLRLSVMESCSFLEEKTVTVVDPRKVTVKETMQKEGGNKESKSTTTKVSTEIIEYHWKVDVKYTLFVFEGTDPEANKIVLDENETSRAIVTNGPRKNSPRPEQNFCKPIDMQVGWLLKNLLVTENSDNEHFRSRFAIDRSKETCKTPRRNDEIDAARNFFSQFRKWCIDAKSCVLQVIPTECLEDMDIFVPGLPFFVEKGNLTSLGTTDEEMTHSSDKVNVLFSVEDINQLLNEQCRSLDERLKDAKREEKASVAVNLLILLTHASEICTSWMDAVSYIEEMLERQLASAIGKEVSAGDFAEYISFHQRKLFSDEFVPKPFCYSIRAPEHSPDGALSITQMNSEGGAGRSIETHVRKLEKGVPLTFPINDTTNIEFCGEQYLHGWITHDFSGSQNSQPVNLIARARQFSSFVLLVGKISGPNSFDPEHAIIVQNKDELIVPLLLNQLPTPKAFRDAIESLSPEQQRFAKAFRAMQLESSVFAVCVIQLKPQLETLLGLPRDSLTKEIRLTEDLLELFVKYQIPSDMVNFSGEEDVAAAEKVSVVKGHVACVQGMIHDVKEKSLEEAEQAADMERELKARNFAMYLCPPVAFGSSSTVECADFSTSSVAFGSSPTVECEQFPTSSNKNMENAPHERTADFAAQTDDNHKTNEFLTEQQGKKTVLEEEKGGTRDASVDLTMIPKKLDSNLDLLDQDSAIRPTIVKTRNRWKKRFQQNILTKSQETVLRENNLKEEKDKAFDLLDALSRSGSIPITCAEIHVIVCATHCFEKNIVDTVVQENVNPIEKCERSMIIVASTIHDTSPMHILRDEDQIACVRGHSPLLLSSREAVFSK